MQQESSPQTPPTSVTPAAKPAAAREPIYAPSSLVLRVTYKCNISCRFCYNSSNLDSDVAIDEVAMRRVIKEARHNGIKRLGLSGGEVFLYTNTMVRMIQLAKSIGYEAVSVVTNGFWGKSETSTKNLINALAKAGFSPPQDKLSMSAGEYHQEWIEPSYARNIIKAYYAAYEQPFTIDFEYSNGKEHLVEQFQLYMRGEGISEEMYTIRPRTFIAPVGRAKDQLEEGSVSLKSPASYGKCNAVNRFVVQPDGFVVPCCGFNETNTGINLGNINEESVGMVIRKGNTNIVNQYLTHVPLGKIHEALAKRFPLPLGYATNCDLCEALFAKPEHVEHLRGLARTLLADYRP